MHLTDWPFVHIHMNNMRSTTHVFMMDGRVSIISRFEHPQIL
ncbi:hypothetical protein E2C01_093312 [Portunus trituberculatus]|uniref:Uncharacterized protein n=1 Tax=Portunus trituberculatus TaxID=210409 RepID=A0A5B7JTN0_PORTR|nr:hypothetical protein [Portunus trituberculatus]